MTLTLREAVVRTALAVEDVAETALPERLCDAYVHEDERVMHIQITVGRRVSGLTGKPIS